MFCVYTMDDGAAAAAAVPTQPSLSSQPADGALSVHSGLKRPGDELNVHDTADDNNNMTVSSSDDDSDGDFEIFLSRYQKRLKRQEKSQEPLHQPANHTSQSTELSASTSNRGGRRGGRQQRHKPAAKHQSPTDPHSGKSRSRSERYDEAINTVVSQVTNQSTNLSCNSSDLCDLRGQVAGLQEQVISLSQQVEFLMSIIGVNPSSDKSDAVPSDPNHPTHASYSAAVTRSLKGRLPDTMVTVAAVHADLKLKESRMHNLVITGLPVSTDYTDEQLFSELCWIEFGVTPVVMQTKRLGRKNEGKLQPVLVVFQEEEQAKLLLSLAKMLRNSADAYTASSIYLSSHLTRAERQAEYDDRCRRRQRSAALSSRPPHDTSRPPVAVPAGGDVLNVPLSISRRSVPAKPGAAGSRRKPSMSRRGPVPSGAPSTSTHAAPSTVPILSAGGSGGIGSAIGNFVQRMTSKLSNPIATAHQSSLNAYVAPFQPAPRIIPGHSSGAVPSLPVLPCGLANDQVLLTVPQLEFYLQQAKQSGTGSFSVPCSAPSAAALHPPADGYPWSSASQSNFAPHISPPNSSQPAQPR